MAIPNSPNWSSLTDVKAYPQPAFVKPPVPAGVAAVSLGPIELNDSKGVLNSRYWLARVSGNTVSILRDVGGSWGNAVTLFTENDKIYNLSLSFDQLGRPIIFYMTTNNVLKLYWYDPTLQQNVSQAITTGYDPTVCFDFPQDTGQQFTDVLLFYVRDDRIYMRVQRDRYNVEYFTGVERSGIRIVEAGLRIDNRLQVEYIWPESEIIKPKVSVTIRPRS